jgi:hypothetical protein
MRVFFLKKHLDSDFLKTLNVMTRKWVAIAAHGLLSPGRPVISSISWVGSMSLRASFA